MASSTPRVLSRCPMVRRLIFVTVIAFLFTYPLLCIGFTFPALRTAGAGNPARLQCGDKLIGGLVSIWIASFDFVTGDAESLWCVWRNVSAANQLQFAGFG